ncbi:MAG: hypothetical protein B6D36_01455 [Planctomycetes bacterium UTPLA1]|jgi:hypothetical protein|nr:MAG: hypothetical protein B6D36_01455 [Planctomycetes bacterium UTPLA1]
MANAPSTFQNLLYFCSSIQEQHSVQILNRDMNMSGRGRSKHESGNPNCVILDMGVNISVVATSLWNCFQIQRPGIK